MIHLFNKICTHEKVCSEQFQIEGFEDKNGSIQNIGGLAGLALSGTKNEVRYPEISDINRLGIYDDIIKITEQEIKNYKTILYTGVNPKLVFHLPSLGGNTTSFFTKGIKYLDTTAFHKAVLNNKSDCFVKRKHLPLNTVRGRLAKEREILGKSESFGREDLGEIGRIIYI